MLTGSDGTIEQGEEVELTSGESYFSQKVFTGKGRWYFEGTHYQSPTQLHLFGFNARNNRGLYFYFFDVPRVYDMYTLEDGTFSARTPSLPFSIEEEHTIGVGIDTFVGQFFVFYENSYYTYSFDPEDFRHNLRVRIWGAWDDRTDTKISVNLGDLPFKYNMSTFTPWSKNQYFLSCAINHFSFKYKVFIISIFWCIS